MKTFELTQEQINQLAEKKHAKNYFKDLFQKHLKLNQKLEDGIGGKDNPKILALYDCLNMPRPYAYICNANGNYEYKLEFSLFELPTYWGISHRRRNKRNIN